MLDGHGVAFQGTIWHGLFEVVPPSYHRSFGANLGIILSDPFFISQRCQFQTFHPVFQMDDAAVVLDVIRAVDVLPMDVASVNWDYLAVASNWKPRICVDLANDLQVVVGSSSVAFQFFDAAEGGGQDGLVVDDDAVASMFMVALRRYHPSVF